MTEDNSGTPTVQNEMSKSDSSTNEISILATNEVLNEEKSDSKKEETNVDGDHSLSPKLFETKKSSLSSDDVQEISHKLNAVYNSSELKQYDVEKSSRKSSISSSSTIQGKNHNEPPPKPKGLGCRHIFAFMGFLGLASVYAMRINMSVAIVDMVKTTSHKSSLLRDHHFVRADFDPELNGTCPDNGEGGDSGNEGEFEWDSETQGLILGAFFWGYMITQIPGGIMAERFGGKYVFGIGILLTGVFCMFTPLAARSGGSGAVIAVRVLTGLAEGVTFPSANAMISKWVPLFERTSIGAFVLAGTQFGTVIILPLAGVLCDLEALNGGWPLAFYIPGLIGVVWFIGWIFLVYDTPQTHPRISEKEKHYILSSIGETKKIPFKDTPWKSMFGSIYLWAILLAHLGHSWGLSMLLTELPTFMKNVLHFDMKANGLLSAMPYLAMWLASIVFSITADYLRRKQVFSTTVVRKIFNTIGLFFPACFLIGAGYTGCDRVSTLVMLTLGTGFNGAVYSGFLVNHVDIASNYAGTMMGLTNCIASICGFVAPSVVSAIVTNPGSVDQWRTVFFLSAGIYAVASLFYIIFGTGVEQPWNKVATQPRKSDPSDTTSEMS